MLHKFIYLLGSRLRNPSLMNQLSFLKKSDSWTLEELEAYQLKKIKELVKFAYKYSPFYREKFDKNNCNPSDLLTLSDIKKLPILTKMDVVEFNEAIQANYSFKKQYKAVTSGSSGNSLSFYRDEYADSFNRASSLRGYYWYDVSPWEKNGYFWGFNFSLRKKIKTLFLDFLQNRFRIFSYKEKSLKKFSKQSKKASYIHGYSSMIYQTAKMINEFNFPKPRKLKMIKGTSEKIFDNYQKEIIEAYGIKMISEYGATESGIIAFECPHESMHLNMESVFVEEVENEILVTNLQMKSFPIIRYKLGDYIKLAGKEKKCSCGRNHLILEEVIGRIGTNIYGKENVYPSLYFYYIFKNLDVNFKLKLNYQILQEEKGKLVATISNVLDANMRGLVEKEFVRYFGNDIDLRIYDSIEIKSDKKKLKSFISKL
jgi:phenylacetate-CoA ligase